MADQVILINYLLIRSAHNIIIRFPFCVSLMRCQTTWNTAYTSYHSHRLCTYLNINKFFVLIDRKIFPKAAYGVLESQRIQEQEVSPSLPQRWSRFQNPQRGQLFIYEPIQFVFKHLVFMLI